MKVVRSEKMCGHEKELCSNKTYEECVEYIKNHIEDTGLGYEVVKSSEFVFGIPWVRFFIKEDSYVINENRYPDMFIVMKKDATERHIDIMKKMSGVNSVIVFEDDPELERKRNEFNTRKRNHRS